ncbi:hypothetical protein BVX95_00165 [archaeon D22]|nr:hypothetical protein BVX95_00165 [archaeon D22]
MKKSRPIFIFLIVLILLVSSVSAVWYAPWTWGKDKNENAVDVTSELPYDSTRFKAAWLSSVGTEDPGDKLLIQKDKDGKSITYFSVDSETYYEPSSGTYFFKNADGSIVPEAEVDQSLGDSRIKKNRILKLLESGSTQDSMKTEVDSDLFSSYEADKRDFGKVMLKKYLGDDPSEKFTHWSGVRSTVKGEIDSLNSQDDNYNHILNLLDERKKVLTAGDAEKQSIAEKLSLYDDYVANKKVTENLQTQAQSQDSAIASLNDESKKIEYHKSLSEYFKAQDKHDDYLYKKFLIEETREAAAELNKEGYNEEQKAVIWSSIVENCATLGVDCEKGNIYQTVRSDIITDPSKEVEAAKNKLQNSAIGLFGEQVDTSDNDALKNLPYSRLSELQSSRLETGNKITQLQQQTAGVLNSNPEFEDSNIIGSYRNIINTGNPSNSGEIDIIDEELAATIAALPDDVIVHVPTDLDAMGYHFTAMSKMATLDISEKEAELVRVDAVYVPLEKQNSLYQLARDGTAWGDLTQEQRDSLGMTSDEYSTMQSKFSAGVTRLREGTLKSQQERVESKIESYSGKQTTLRAGKDAITTAVDATAPNVPNADEILAKIEEAKTKASVQTQTVPSNEAKAVPTPPVPAPAVGELREEAAPVQAQATVTENGYPKRGEAGIIRWVQDPVTSFTGGSFDSTAKTLTVNTDNSQNVPDGANFELIFTKDDPNQNLDDRDIVLIGSRDEHGVVTYDLNSDNYNHLTDAQKLSLNHFASTGELPAGYENGFVDVSQLGENSITYHASVPLTGEEGLMASSAFTTNGQAGEEEIPVTGAGPEGIVGQTGDGVGSYGDGLYNDETGMTYGEPDDGIYDDETGMTYGEPDDGVYDDETGMTIGEPDDGDDVVPGKTEGSGSAKAPPSKSGGSGSGSGSSGASSYSSGYSSGAGVGFLSFPKNYDKVCTEGGGVLSGSVTNMGFLSGPINMIYSILLNEIALYVLLFLLAFISFYSIYVAALKKVKVFEDQPKPKKMVSVSFALITVIGFFGMSAKYGGPKAIMTRFLTLGVTFGSIMILIWMYTTIKAYIGTNADNSTNWGAVVLGLGIGLLIIGNLICISWMVKYGVPMIIIGIIGFIFSSFRRRGRVDPNPDANVEVRNAT